MKSVRWRWFPATCARIVERSGGGDRQRIRESLKAPWREVVGVVSDERDDGVNQESAAACALADTDVSNFSGNNTFVERSPKAYARSANGIERIYE